MAAPDPIPFYGSDEEEEFERQATLQRYLDLDLGDDTYISLCSAEHASRLRQTVDDGGYMTTLDMQNLAGVGLLDDPGYLSFAELHGGVGGVDEPAYMSIVEVQKAAGSLPPDADYLSVMELRSALDRLEASTDGGYMSLEEVQGQLNAARAKPKTAGAAGDEPEYMTLLEVQQQVGGRIDEATLDYLSVVDMQKARGQLPVEADYMTVAELLQGIPAAAAAPAAGEEPEYMTVEQIQSLGQVCRPTAEEAGYMSLGEVQAQVQAFKDKIRDEEPEYLSIAEMASLAGPVAFKAWVSETATKAATHLKQGKKPPKSTDGEGASEGAWLRHIRDEIIREEMAEEHRQEDRDRALARSLQQEEVRRSVEEELAREEVYLNALETLYDAVQLDPGLKRGTFLSLAGCRALKEATTGEPDFPAFEKRCARVVALVGKAQPLLRAGPAAELDREAVFYACAKVVKALQKAYKGLGEAATLDLGDSLQQKHLHKLGANVWAAARHFGPKSRRTTSDAAAELASWLARLAFVSDRILFEREGPLDIDDRQIRRRINQRRKLQRRQLEADRAYQPEAHSATNPPTPQGTPVSAAALLTPWACPACTLENPPGTMACEACGTPCPRDGAAGGPPRRRAAKQRLRIALAH